MRAALKTADGKFEVREVERPIMPGNDFVLARVRVADICGTDLRHWKKAEPELECHIVGHELAGEVVQVGADVVSLKPGDRVVIETVTVADFDLLPDGTLGPYRQPLSVLAPCLCSKHECRAVDR